MTLLAEQPGERVDRVEQERVDAGLLAGGATGAELGDGAAVPGPAVELADPGGNGRGHVRPRAAARGPVSPG